MPELPEVETMRRGIRSIVGSRIDSIEFPRSRCKPIRLTPGRRALRRRVVNRTIQSVDRIAKRVLVRLDSDDTIVFEPRMTGLVLLCDPPSHAHLRVGFALQNRQHPMLWYWDRRGLGSVRLMNPQEIADQLGPRKLGPDALAISLHQLKDRLRSSKRFIKVALLDQRAIAGIGNLYASEILFHAGLHPEKKCCNMSSGQWQRVFNAIGKVLNAAIRYEGSTLSDGTYRNALNKSGRYQNQHQVYGKTEQPCLRCQRLVIRCVHAQRSTFFCPGCQRK